MSKSLLPNGVGYRFGLGMRRILHSCSLQFASEPNSWT
jgi:hypothetical protein